MSTPPQPPTPSTSHTPATPEGDQGERAARVQAGALLRAAREAAGRSVAELATQLKVSSDRIVALEAGDWDVLHDAAHARGLLRAAAKAVQADVDAVLSPLPPVFVRGSAILPPKGATLGPARPAAPVGTQTGTRRLVWMALLLVAVALGLLYLPRDDRLAPMLAQVRSLLGHRSGEVRVAGPAQPDGVNPSNAASAAAPAAQDRPSPGATASSAAAAPAASAAVATASAPAAATAAVAGAPVSAGSTAAASAGPPGPSLNLAASAKSWVQVRSNSGRTLFSGVLGSGASQEIPTRQGDYPLHLIVGNAAQTQVTLGGKTVPLHAGSGNVARLVLPATGM